jgi:hypothetical protein
MQRDDRLVRRDDRRLHLHRLEHDERLARLHASPSADEHLITVPGIGARERALLAPRRACDARVDVRRRRRAAARAG